MRVAAILHPYEKDSGLQPFKLPGANLFRGNMLEKSDIPDAALVFGGDGSVHRVIQSLAGSACPLLVVPTGSGNDFADALGLTSVGKALDAWQRFLAGEQNTRTIDLGVITPLSERAPVQDEDAVPIPRATYARDDGTFEKPEENLAPAIMRQHLHFLYDAISSETYFCCIGGVGLDSDTNRRANKLPAWVRSHGGYPLSAFAALMSYRPQAMSVSLPDAEGNFRVRVSEPALLVAFGNAPAYGNGMRMTAEAKLDDGLLDVCFVRRAGKLRVTRLFHTIYSGKHLRLPEVEYFRANHLWVESETPLPIYADGEYVCDTPAEVRLQSAALKVIVP